MQEKRRFFFCHPPFRKIIGPFSRSKQLVFREFPPFSSLMKERVEILISFFHPDMGLLINLSQRLFCSVLPGFILKGGRLLSDNLRVGLVGVPNCPFLHTPSQTAALPLFFFFKSSISLLCYYHSKCGRAFFFFNI